ncbi:hypothetical protein M8542_40185 [Amycolatopsis sp. OK19-0408]|uniref:Uncharacterized protein n=1 Tax=Amycolatopsis iheyensis TaxID=2945988 RepID=A0A9X2NK85_9PSEU|nr:hypothetical protein [Amycolatopsis iheyensis]
MVEDMAASSHDRTRPAEAADGYFPHSAECGEKNAHRPEKEHPGIL